jgi:predicted TPR repeat methyltransferase
MGQPEAHRRYFDAHAESYDEYTGNGAWTPNQYLAGVLEKLITDGAEVRTALDLGTGTGQTLAVVHTAFPQAQLWASDVSPAMLERAARKVPSALFEVADISSYVADLTESFDLVTAVGCLELVPDLESVLPKLIQHVNPGGHLALTFEPVIDEVGAEYAAGTGSPDADIDNEQRWHYTWSTARVLGALPGGQLRSSHLFTAYERAGTPVLYELLLIRRDDQPPPH